jgi:GMC oxidoreductase
MIARTVAVLVLLASYCVWDAKAFSAVVRSNVRQTAAAFFRRDVRLYATTDQGLFTLKTRETLETEKYDLIVVGSGNGACGFLSHYLRQAGDVRVLVLERGQNFFFTSDITHQNEWTKSYSEGPIFKLHNTRTKDGKPILSGGACTMGGGGSINYTMIHEANSWLAKHLGRNEKYWRDLKAKLNKRFHRPDPTKDQTDITTHILEKGEELGFAAPESSRDYHYIPNHDDAREKQLYQFPTQFNTFGQRTNSGVSIVEWADPRLRLETLVEVQDLEFAASPITEDDAECVSVKVMFLDTKASKTIRLKDGGRVILCGGGATPRLLMKQEELRQNIEIGKGVSDHIALPLGIYVKPKSIKLSPKDIYGPVFATTVLNPEGVDQDKIVVTLDFFTGKLETLLYLTSHLYLAFLLPNWLKNFLWTRPRCFAFTQKLVLGYVYVLNRIISWIVRGNDPEFITAIVKFNPSATGQYDDTTDNRITLGWFEDKQDKPLAKEIISEAALPLLELLGEKPNWFVQDLYRFATRVPYNVEQINCYLDNYAKNSLLSQQHLSGGCLLGKALASGEKDPPKTGKVKGSRNLYVADLSAVPLPRVSPSMTAYLVGFHVANQMYPTKL